MSEETPQEKAGNKPSRRFALAWKQWAVEALRGALDLVLPRECPICEADVDEDLPGSFGSPFCSDCRLELLDAAGPSCGRCAMPIGPYADLDGPCRECQRKLFGFQGAFALGPYSGPIRDLVLEMKHSQGAWLGHWLAGLLADARPRLRELAAADPTMLIVPVPLHWRREWSRGYNQSEELADGLARKLGLKFARVLRRVEWSGILVGRGRTQREKALKGAFRVKRFARSKVEGRTILLVDDVLTTGATASAASRTLKKAGAARVILAVIGRAEGKSGG